MTPSVNPLGNPRLHLRVTDSTNLRARELAARGAPHGTLVTAGRQDAGRGRQGRAWAAPTGRSLLMSLVLRDPPPLVSLAAGVAVADVVAASVQLPDATVAIKWPNDVELDGGKVAGILVEGRPQGGWAVLGIGLNVAVELAALPAEVRDRAATLGLEPGAIEHVLERLLAALQDRLTADPEQVLAAVRARDALRGRAVAWAAGQGTGAGIDAEGRLQVDTGSGTAALDSGEVHLLKPGSQPPTPP